MTVAPELELDVLTALDPEQRTAAEAVRGPVCILAGAGTGKTRAITHRIAFAVRTGSVAPAHVLAVTFTARAAGELRGRLRALGVGSVQARTFHSAALRQLQYFWPRTIGGELPAILKSKVPLLAEVASRLRLGLSSSDLRDVASEIEWMKALQRPPDDYASSVQLAHRIAPRPEADVTAMYAGYEDLKVRKNLFDFEDLLLHATALLETEPDVASQVRDQYRYFVVDEYQDVNPAQQRLLDAWLGNRDDLCVVGDPEQTIYSFAGASPAYLTGFASRFPAATVVRLVRDYRSTPQVVALANRLSGGALVAQRPAGPVPVISSYDDEVAEASAVAARAAKLVADGTPPVRSRCCSASTRSRRPTSRRWPRPVCLTSCVGASGSSSGPRSARHSSCFVAPHGPGPRAAQGGRQRKARQQAGTFAPDRQSLGLARGPARHVRRADQARPRIQAPIAESSGNGRDV